MKIVVCSFTHGNNHIRRFLVPVSPVKYCCFKTMTFIDLSLSFTTQGIARRLVKAALQEAAKKREIRYADLKRIARGVRRHFHDDITVVVVFIDHHSIHRTPLHSSPLSIRGGGGVTAPANS